MLCAHFIFANNTNPPVVATNPPAVAVSDTTQSNTPQVQYVVTNLPKAAPEGTCRHCSACKGLPVCVWCDCSNCDYTLLYTALCNVHKDCCYEAW